MALLKWKRGFFLKFKVSFRLTWTRNLHKKTIEKKGRSFCGFKKTNAIKKNSLWCGRTFCCCNWAILFRTIEMAKRGGMMSLLDCVLRSHLSTISQSQSLNFAKICTLIFFIHFISSLLFKRNVDASVIP